MNKFFWILLFLSAGILSESKEKNPVLEFGAFTVHIEHSENENSDIKSRITIEERLTRKVFQEFQLADIIASHVVKKHGNGNILFLETYLPSERNTGSRLKYIIENPVKMNIRKIDEAFKDYLILDLGRDGYQEIIFLDYRYTTLVLDDCIDISPNEDPSWPAGFLPNLYVFHSNRYVSLKLPDAKPFFQAYLKELEAYFLETMENDALALKDFIHYYFTASKVKMGKRALKFIRSMDRKIDFSCREINAKSSEADPIRIEMNLYDFIRKYRKQFK
ncbi:MAG TPA: hypothetical protein PL048_16805 [Leptospiraceae bacterium]|nr:hypothetical protein [Leptospiraceae bacterium]HMZ60440.1 hypothetical protein [Leptospiraceae bacterium]HNF15196.1 hypothetical protein [Leptospiraceae bacterium]HNI96896.1 hypothetical protein [Leptospiraceae bacterium]HNN03720.1 hypothetical protein [Leptospiraceae bacterium]